MLRDRVGCTPESTASSGDCRGDEGWQGLAANVLCLMLLWKRWEDDINMRSAWVCSRNDIVGNVGVLVGAIALYFTGSPWPDSVIGILLAALFGRSAIAVIRATSRELQFSN
ncbi:MAG: hypothetical protein CK534_02140 [Nitrospirae bacterium]|nr:MAG: hypothetical protein CK534_02140 [Nitrospirota bacterium]